MNRGGGMGKPFSATNKLVLMFAVGFQRMVLNTAMGSYSAFTFNREKGLST